MHKSILIFFIAFGLFFFSSCSFSKLASLNLDNDFVKSEKTIEQIISCINNRDGDFIKSLFSETALNEATNVDEGINYLFSTVSEEINKYERIGGSVDESNSYGEKEKNIDTVIICTQKVKSI